MVLAVAAAVSSILLKKRNAVPIAPLQPSEQSTGAPPTELANAPKDETPKGAAADDEAPAKVDDANAKETETTADDATGAKTDAPPERVDLPDVLVECPRPPPLGQRRPPRPFIGTGMRKEIGVRTCHGTASLAAPAE